MLKPMIVFICKGLEIFFAGLEVFFEILIQQAVLSNLILYLFI